MSLLDRTNETIVLYPEVVTYDRDGNEITKPSTEGITLRVTIQPASASGTSARRSEQDNEGFETEANYRMRLKRGTNIVIGAQARIEWNGEYWAIVGDRLKYRGSRRTRHDDYTIRRS